jgi:hypothetical protein
MGKTYDVYGRTKLGTKVVYLGDHYGLSKIAAIKEGYFRLSAAKKRAYSQYVFFAVTKKDYQKASALQQAFSRLSEYVQKKLQGPRNYVKTRR